LLFGVATDRLKPKSHLAWRDSLERARLETSAD